jgi:hypothetical protein
LRGCGKSLGRWRLRASARLGLRKGCVPLGSVDTTVAVAVNSREEVRRRRALRGIVRPPSRSFCQCRDLLSCLYPRRLLALKLGQPCHRSRLHLRRNGFAHARGLAAELNLVTDDGLVNPATEDGLVNLVTDDGLVNPATEDGLELAELNLT